jgi:hypothetical protein
VGILRNVEKLLENQSKEFETIHTLKASTRKMLA